MKQTVYITMFNFFYRKAIFHFYYYYYCNHYYVIFIIIAFISGDSISGNSSTSISWSLLLLPLYYISHALDVTFTALMLRCFPLI